jgi:hypothetical protein
MFAGGNMKKTIIAVVVALSSFCCFGGNKEKQPPIEIPDYSAKLEEGMYEATYPKITKEEWFTKQTAQLKICDPTNKYEEIEFISLSPNNPDDCVEQFTHYATGRNGYHYFNKTNWVVLVTCQFHNYPYFDAVLLMDQNRDFYTIETHPCGGLEVYSERKIKIDSLENLLKTVSKDGNKWAQLK